MTFRILDNIMRQAAISEQSSPEMTPGRATGLGLLGLCQQPSKNYFLAAAAFTFGDFFAVAFAAGLAAGLAAAAFTFGDFAGFLVSVFFAAALVDLAAAMSTHSVKDKHSGADKTTEHNSHAPAEREMRQTGNTQGLSDRS